MQDPTPPTKRDDIREHGRLGEGGDTSRSVAPYARPDPDARATSPDPAATNYNHPAVPGTQFATPGEGVVTGDTEASSSSRSHPDHPPHVIHQHLGHIADGVNRVEDVVPGGEARLSMPTDEAGPSSHSVGVPELSDPNYSAATPGARGIPAKDSPLRK